MLRKEKWSYFVRFVTTIELYTRSVISISFFFLTVICECFKSELSTQRSSHSGCSHNKCFSVVFGNRLEVYLLLSIIKIYWCFPFYMYRHLFWLTDIFSIGVQKNCVTYAWGMIFYFCFCLQETLIESLAKLEWKTLLQVKYCGYTWNSMMFFKSWWFLVRALKPDRKF